MPHRLFAASAIVALFLVVGAAPGFADDGVPPGAYARVNAALVENHVLPRYRRLVEETGALDDAVAGFCADPDPAGLEAVRARYHDTMDAWMAVRHLSFGPVELLMRGYRFYFWPEARGKIGSTVAELLAADDAAALTPDRFRRASVAVQGLPAAEYLLYGNTAATWDRKGNRCELLAAISGNMRRMAAGIRAEWQDGDAAFTHAVSGPGPDKPYFRTHRDATLAFFKGFHGGLQLIADVKLTPVVGASIDGARPRAAESRLSRRALRNIVVNLEALQALYLGDGGPGFSDLVKAHGGDAKLDPLMRKAFDLTIANARSIELSLGDAIKDPAERPKAEKLKTQVVALNQIVKTRVATALGLGVGFNALDGD